MAIKLIALDLDGTLLRSDHSPHPAVPLSLERAAAAGIVITIASGRSIQSINRVASAFTDVSSAVATNGADIWASAHKNVERTYLHPSVNQSALAFAEQNGLHISCYAPDATYSISESGFLEEYRRLLQGLPVPVIARNRVEAMDLFKVVFIDEPDVIQQLRTEVAKWLDPDHAEITESSPRYLEILPKSTNKGTGLLRLCEHLDIDMKDVAAIGDYRNDLEMLKFVGLSGAVANGLAEVKSAASVRVKSNEDGGVAEFIDRYVLQL